MTQAIKDAVLARLASVGKPQTLSDLWDHMDENCSVSELRPVVEAMATAGELTSDRDARGRRRSDGHGRRADQ